MKTKRLILAMLISSGIALSFYSCDLDETQTVTTFKNLVLEDEFEGNELNTNLWTYEIGTGANGWGNNELQYYTDRPENIKVENGLLIITALRESFEGAAFTSARIKTQDKFDQTYGRFEARMKMPWGQGLWPAFWLLGADIDQVGWPQTGEIDVMEYRGQEPTIVHGSIHGPGYSGSEAVTKEYEFLNERLDTEFHIYGIEWDEGSINFYVDGFLYNTITPDDEDVTGDWVFDKPFFMLLNMAVGGSFVGSPTLDTVFPQTLEIDYIRVYEK
jgi:beta-glucanase (GH16 family)